MTKNQSALLDAAVAMRGVAIKVRDEIDQYGECSLGTRDDLEEAIARFETWHVEVVRDYWLKANSTGTGGVVWMSENGTTGKVK